MKKKLLTIVLAVCLLCTTLMFTSCENASDLIGKAMENTKALESYSATLNMDMKMTVMGKTEETSTTAKMMVENAKGDDMKMSTDMCMKMLGKDMDTKMYMADGWIYMELSGQKVKAKADSAMVSQYDYSENIEDMLTDIPAELLKDVEVKNGANGTKTMTVTLDDEAFSELYEDLLDEMDDAFDSLGDIGDAAIKLENATLNFAVNDGYFTEYGMSFDMVVSVAGEEAKAEVDMTLTFDKPGQPVTVTLPSNLDQYLDISGF